MKRSSQASPAESFQMKGGLFPMTLLELKSKDLAQVQRELQVKVEESKEFFAETPVVIGFDFLSEDDQNDIKIVDVINLCRTLNLKPAATRGGLESLQKQSLALGLANLPRVRDKAAKELEAVPPKAEVKTATKLAGSSSKVITTPVRSGQQIYAAGGDLIILASVSAGAEVLADGSIHVYGPLRGRALAGVQGDENARIFCGSQEAELVSIAGQYLVDETLRTSGWKEAVQIQLESGTLKIHPLFTNQ